GAFTATGPLVGYVSSTGNGADETTDDDGDENGVDTLFLQTKGISSTLYTLTPNTEITGENQVNYTGYLDDDNVNFTADFGFFTATLSLGDLVWYDYDNNGIYEPAAGETGVSGVLMELYRAGDVPATTPALLTTTTDAAGRYLFSGLSAGQYFVHIPPSQFESGRPLFGYESTVPTEENADNDQNEDVDENGIPVSGGRAAIAGVSSGIVTLAFGTEPTGEDVADLDHTTPDPNSNLTVDFGFYRITAFGLEMTKEATPTQVVPGEMITYTIRLTNTGQSVISPLVLTDTLPSPLLDYVVGSGRPSDPDTIAGQTLIWRDLGPLNPAQAIAVTFAVTVTGTPSEPLVNVAFAGGGTPTGTITGTGTTTVTVGRPAVEVIKQLTERDWFNGVFTFTIRVRNVGSSTLDIVPLADDYDYRYLRFVAAAPYSPTVVDHASGWIAWDDLTQSFGRDLVPDDQFVVTTTFIAVADITQTVNTAIVTGAVDTGGNPADEDDDDEPITAVPTALTLRYLRAIAQEDGNGVLVEWATWMELDTYGFQVYRGDQSQLDRAEQLASQPALGGADGATYSYWDDTARPGRTYWYWLLAVNNDGGRATFGPVSVTVPTAGAAHRLYLPLVVRGQ
ncbi:MAG TPA: DUF11 domain-containing protein, partial [Anaerolineae bacterium]|nr:DUF11 domain-containing protein [Anaerolineae bacterium]